MSCSRKWSIEKQRAASREWYQRNKSCPQRAEKEREKAIRRRLKNTGFCPELFAIAMDLQAGACAICEADLSNRKQCADHDHATGAPRGVLCDRCNLALGLFQDRAELLRSAVLYLEDPTLTEVLGML